MELKLSIDIDELIEAIASEIQAEKVILSIDANMADIEFTLAIIDRLLRSVEDEFFGMESQYKIARIRKELNNMEF